MSRTAAVSRRSDRRKTNSSLSEMFEISVPSHETSRSSAGSTRSATTKASTRTNSIGLSRKLRRMKRRLLLEAVADMSGYTEPGEDDENCQKARTVRYMLSDVSIGEAPRGCGEDSTSSDQDSICSFCSVSNTGED